MILIFTWLSVVTSSQTQQFYDVFISAFLPQGRETSEELADYFNNKIKPRLEQEQLIYTVLDCERIVGFVVFERWGDQSYYLAEMAIAPEYQRQGLGKQLVFSIFDKDPTTQKIVLVTEEANRSAQLFYEKIGFTRTSFSHPDYVNFIGYEFLR
jgi:ribosomal protein S18 acetylase RimI-like enzyme